MSDRPVRSALAHRNDRDGAAGLSVRIREVSDRAMIDLRGLAHDEAFMTGAAEALGFALPSLPRTSTGAGDVAALWLSVDQWLITAARSRATPLSEALHEKLRGMHCLIADLSDARAVLRLEGENVRAVLNKGTSVDFTSGEYAAGSVRRVLYAQVAGLVHVVSETPDVIDLYVFRSYADYVWRYLLATGKEGARIRLFGDQTAAGP